MKLTWGGDDLVWIGLVSAKEIRGVSVEAHCIDIRGGERKGCLSMNM